MMNFDTTLIDVKVPESSATILFIEYHHSCVSLYHDDWQQHTNCPFRLNICLQICHRGQQMSTFVQFPHQIHEKSRFN